MNSKTIAGLALVAATPFLTGAAPANGEIVIDITNLRSAKGTIQACLTTQKDNFPQCYSAEGSQTATIPANGNKRLTFEAVEPGKYAIALLHDENDNKKMDLALGMMPKEGFGFSRDAKVRMGPPKFKSAAFAYDGEGAQMTIKMRYLL